MPRCYLLHLVLAALLSGGHQTGTVATLMVDATALDRDGRAVTSLGPDDFRVSVDGTPGKVVAVRYAFRDPRAYAGAGRASLAAGVPAVAEYSRAVFFAIDEASIVPGTEKSVVDMVTRAVDALAADDRLGLVSLPKPRGSLTLTSGGRKAISSGLSRVAGRASDLPPRGERDESNRQWDDDPTNERQQTIADRQPGLAGVAGAGAGADKTDGDAAVRTSLPALARLVAAMAAVPGMKAVVFVSGGMDDGPGTGWRQRDDDVDAVINTAVSSRVVVHLLTVPGRGRGRVRSSELERMAGATGGICVSATEGERAAVRLMAALSGSYLLEIEAPGITAGKQLNRLSITTTARDVTVFAPSRRVAGSGGLASVTAPKPAPLETVASATPSTPPGAATPPEDGGPARMTIATLRPLMRRPDPALEDLMTKVCAYVDAYVRDFSNVVVEEEYRQHLTEGGQQASAKNHMVLRSDVLLVRTAGPEGWIPFRDVFEVNGNPVRDREERLRRLFLQNPGAAMAEGLRITEESARYNLGSLYRTINLPTLGLVFLMPANVDRLRFDRRRDEVVDGITTTRIDFRETGRPTLIQRSRSGGDVPSEGSFWVDAISGRIVRTRVLASVDSFNTSATVTYRPNPALGIWTPIEMQESYFHRRESFNGVATYKNFRRFQVTTEEKVGIPK